MRKRHIENAAGKPDRPLCTTKQAANRLSVSEWHLWTLRNSGKIPFILMGRSIRFYPLDLDAYVDQNKFTLETYFDVSSSDNC